MNVFRGLAAVLEPADRRTLRRVTVLAAVHGLAQGVTMVLVVPVARALAAGETGSAWTWLLVLGMSVLVTGVVGYAQAMGGFRLAVAAMRTLHLRVGDHLARLPVGWFTGRTGELSELLSRGVLTVGGSPGYLLTPLVTLTTSATTVAAGLLLIDVRLGLIALLLGAGVLVVARAATALGSRGDEAQHRAVVEVDDRIVEFARCQGAIRASGASARYEPLGRALADHEGRARQGLWSSVVALGLNGLAAQTAFSLVVLALVALALRGTLDPVEMVATFALVSRFVEPINEIGAYRSGVRSTGRAIDRLGAVLGAPTLPEPADPVDGRGGAVELDGVTFAYEPGRPVLTDVSLRVGPGTTTAVVGASGAGKTTLLRLVARERDVDAGRVLVGGVDVRDRSSSGLAADLTAVLQDVYLLEGTLRENVLIGNLAA
ncbi:MAG: ATP-binding cassette domain-containing protein, partial [Actinomycetaceae bacterium]